MTIKEEMTAPYAPVDAGAEQSFKNLTNTIITETKKNCNPEAEYFARKQIEMLNKMNPNYIETVSMPELYEMVYTGKAPIIDGLLYPGTYLFVGSPKVGKSFMMAQIAYHVSSGTSMWNCEVRKGTVLYLALEDDYKRLQARLYRMFGTEMTENLFFSVASKSLGQGLNEQLRSFITNHPDTNLIIIDTLQKVRKCDSDNYSYAKDYEIITQLKSFADSMGICLLLVHHTRKQKADDGFDMISGTNGLLGAADGAFLLHKEKRTSRNAVLEISGRDQQDRKFHLIRNEQTLAWDLERVENELWKEPAEPLLDEIAKLITKDTPDWIGNATDLSKILQVDIPVNSLTKKLNVNAGKLLNDYGISYRYTKNHEGRFLEFHLVSESP